MVTKELINIIRNIEKLENDRTSINESIKDAFAESKIKGYNVKILKQIIQLRKLSEEERIRFEGELTVYKEVLEMK